MDYSARKRKVSMSNDALRKVLAKAPLLCRCVKSRNVPQLYFRGQVEYREKSREQKKPCKGFISVFALVLFTDQQPVAALSRKLTNTNVCK